MFSFDDNIKLNKVVPCIVALSLLQRYECFKFFTFKKLVTVMEYSFRNVVIWRQISKSVMHFFAQALIVSEIFTFQKCLPSESRSMTMSRSIIFAMANITFYQSRLHIFALALTISEILTFLFFIQFKSRSRSAVFSMAPFDGEYQNL